jgi:hypothetical protein
MHTTNSRQIDDMSNNRGIFEGFPNQPVNRQDSPFAVAPDTASEAVPPSPFSAAPRQDSPFTVVDEAAESAVEGFGKPVKLPERRKVDSPFQMAEPPEGFGFEAPPKAFGANPFESAPAAPVTTPPPFSAPAQAVPASPFAVEPQRTAASPSTQAAIAAFTEWQEPAAQAPATPPASMVPPPVQVPSAFAPAPQAAPAAAAQPAATFAPAAPAAPAFQPHTEEPQSDSFNIRQLELRAIFGVDREMNAEEILQRTRALPGMRNIARLSAQDMASIDAVKHLLPSLGFGGGALKLYSGSVPLEFIREGSVMLAVQTDGGFAPGVRETLMIVARELGRLG